MSGARDVSGGPARARGHMRYREMMVGLCLALAACAGKSTIGAGKGKSESGASGGSSGMGSVAAGMSNGVASSDPPPEGETCGHVQCGAGESCCLVTLECFDPIVHPEACARPTDLTPVGDTSLGLPCASNVHCAADEMCDTDLPLCGGPGHCRRLSFSGDCVDDGTGWCQVCGCDGKDYPTAIAALTARTNYLHWSRACGDSLYPDDVPDPLALLDAGAVEAVKITVCGSDADCPRDGDACCALTAVCYPKSDPGQCGFPPPGTYYPCTSNAQCGSGSYCAGEGCGTPGGCTSTEVDDEVCGQILKPVCGCNGMSYTSPACAIWAGTRVASEGECPE